MTYESDGFHATTAMAGAVQPVLDQPRSSGCGGLGADDGIAVLLTYGPTEWRPIFARLPFEQAVLLTRA
jgi:hypothetical protein